MDFETPFVFVVGGVSANKKSSLQKSSDTLKQRIDLYDELRDRLRLKLKTGIIDEQKYYDTLADIRDRYLDINSKKWRESFLEAYEYNQKIIAENKQALDELFRESADEALTALDKIIAKRERLEKKLAGFNNDLKKVTETIPETVAVKGDFTVTTAEHTEEVYRMGADSVEDHIKLLNRYADMLDALKSRGADEETMNGIVSLDIDEAIEAGSKLLSMSDTEWNAYFDSLEKLRQTAARISEDYYGKEIDDIKSGFFEKLEGELGDLDLTGQGADSAMAFIDGWNGAIGRLDLSLDDFLNAFAGGSIEQAPMAARTADAAGISAFSVTGFSAEQNEKLNGALNALAGIIENAAKSDGKTLTTSVFVGADKLMDIVTTGLIGNNIKSGKTTVNY